MTREGTGENMKRIIVVLIMVMTAVFSISTNAEEMTFQSIPWLSNEAIVMQSLFDKGFIRDIYVGELSSEKSVVINRDEDEFVWPVGSDRFPEGICVSSSLAKTCKGNVAGFPVLNIIPTYAYNGDYQLISIKIELIGANFDSLREKLINKYGDGERLYDEEGLETYIWKGDNESCVILYTASEGRSFDLIYGRLDAAEILSNCLNVDPDDVSGL